MQTLCSPSVISIFDADFRGYLMKWDKGCKYEVVAMLGPLLPIPSENL